MRVLYQHNVAAMEAMDLCGMPRIDAETARAPMLSTMTSPSRNTAHLPWYSPGWITRPPTVAVVTG